MNILVYHIRKLELRSAQSTLNIPTASLQLNILEASVFIQQIISEWPASGGGQLHDPIQYGNEKSPKIHSISESYGPGIIRTILLHRVSLENEVCAFYAYLDYGPSARRALAVCKLDIFNSWSFDAFGSLFLFHVSTSNEVRCFLLRI